MTESSSDAGKLAVELGVVMVRIRSRLRRESRVVTTKWSWSQLATLVRIIADGPITVSALAQAEHVRPQSMAETVAVLKADGLVSARSDPKDGRKTLISATTEGVQLIETLNSERDESLSHIIESVIRPEEMGDLVAAVELLKRLADSEPAAADERR